MRLIEAIERKPFTLSINEVITNEGDFTFIENVRNKNYFTIEFRKTTLTFVAGNHIGIIPLTPDIAIHVKPKVPIGNLARLVSLANQPIVCLDYYKRVYQINAETSQSIHEALAQSLVNCLYDLDREGLYREYIRKDESLIGLRGKVNIKKFVKTTSSQKYSNVLPCTFFELTADTKLNRIIKSAVFKIGYTLAACRTKNSKLLKELNYFANYFESVELDTGNFLAYNARNYLANVKVPTLRNYYLNILDVCCVILDGKGVNLLENSGNDTLYSFIVNLEDAFEVYIRRVLYDASEIIHGIPIVLDGNKEAKAKLFQDSSMFDAKPDIVFGTLDNVLAIGDVKYKTHLAEADRYQLISHASAYKANIAFFITPTFENGDSSHQYIGKINNISIYHYQINLEAEDLSEAENAFQTWVWEIINPLAS